MKASVARSACSLATIVFFLSIGVAVRAQNVHTNREGTKRLPLTKEDGVWHFIVYGDRTGGPASGIKILAQAVRDTNLLDPDLVMTVGDLVNGYNDTPAWLVQMREFQSVMGGLHMPWYPVPGNHDVYWRGKGPKPIGENEQIYEKYFGPLWYWFAHKDAAFIVLYTDEGDRKTNTKGFDRREHMQMSPEQLDFLRGALAANRDREHIFVFLHHPRWMPRYAASNWPEVHEILRSAGNVSAVFAGHVHHMHYMGPTDGIEYVTLATTGATLSRSGFPMSGHLHHFNVVTVRKSGISLATIPVGQVMDPRIMTDAHLAEMDKLRGHRAPKVIEPASIASDGSAHGRYALTLTNPSSRPIETTLAFDRGNSEWRFQPDHVHVEIGPGREQRLEFAYVHPAGVMATALPKLERTVEYLGENFRVQVPTREFDFDVRLEEVAAEFFDRPAGVLTLPGRSCVRVPGGAASPPQGAMTIEGWLRADELAGRRPFLAKSESSEYCMFVSNGIPSFSVHLNGKYVEAKGKEELEVKCWTHLAGVYDESELRLYVDGKLVARTPASGIRTLNALPLYLGADPNREGLPVDCLKGQIDEVRLSKISRYDDEFTPSRRFAPDADTLLLFHLDADIGVFCPDHSSDAAHGRRVGRARCGARSSTAL